MNLLICLVDFLSNCSITSIRVFPLVIKFMVKEFIKTNSSETIPLTFRAVPARSKSKW